MRKTGMLLATLLAFSVAPALAQGNLSISGTVTVDSNPAGGIRVLLMTPQAYSALIRCDGSNGVSQCASQASTVDVTETASDGTYRLNNVPQPGEYYVVYLPPTDPQHHTGSQDITVNDGPVTGVDFDLNGY